MLRIPSNINTIRLAFDVSNFDQVAEVLKDNCGSVNVFHVQHGDGGSCKNIMDIASVCARVFSSCDSTIYSVSCSSFSDINAAIAQANNLVKSVSPGRKVTITGQQSDGVGNNFLGNNDFTPQCSNTATITIDDHQASCTAVSQCRNEGEMCQPAGNSSICTVGGVRKTQSCCSAPKNIFGISGKFAKPGFSCSGSPLLSCTGTDPSNTVSCPSAGLNLTTATSKELVTSCSADLGVQAQKCEYTCKPGYTLRSSGLPGGVVTNTCVQIKPCQGAVPDNANFCPGTETTSATVGTNHAVSSCPSSIYSGNNTTIAFPNLCSYTCKPGSTFVNGKCLASTPGTSCLGVPANSTACPVTNSAGFPMVATIVPGCNDSNPMNLIWGVTGLDPSGYGESHGYIGGQCQVTCNSGYAKQGDTCALANGKCTGTVPANSILCTGTDKNLFANASNIVVSSCDQATSVATPASCRYSCKQGYVYDNGSCRLPKCTGTIPSNGTMCAGSNTLMTSDTSYHNGSTCPVTNTASDDKCVFKCSSGFTYNSGTKMCDRNVVIPTCPSGIYDLTSHTCVANVSNPVSPSCSTNCTAHQIMRNGCCVND